MIDDPEIHRTVLQRLSVGVYFVDREQRIVFWNTAPKKSPATSANKPSATK